MPFKDIVKKNLIYLLPFTLYKIAIDLLYIQGTSEIYAYLGRNLDFVFDKYIYGWASYVFILLLINSIKEDGIRFMVKLIFLLSGVANISVYGLCNYATKHFVIVLLFWIILVALCSFVPNLTELQQYKKSSESLINISFPMDSVLLVIGILFTGIEIAKYGLNVTSADTIYTARSTFRALKISSIDTYILSWTGTVILPWAFVNMLDKNKYIRAIIIAVFGVLLFQINGMKTWLVLYIVIICFVFFMKKTDIDKTISLILLGSSMICFTTLIIYKINHSLYSWAGYMDRIFLLPGETNYYYLEFFDSHEKLYLRESIMKSFFKSPYEPISSIQIGFEYMKAAFYHNSTNGLIGDYYANFGIVGIVIYPVALSISFYILNIFTSRFESSIKKSVIFILMWTLINTSFFTWLLTGGYFVYLLIMLLYQYTYNKENEE